MRIVLADNSAGLLPPLGHPKPRTSSTRIATRDMGGAEAYEVARRLACIPRTRRTAERTCSVQSK